LVAVQHTPTRHDGGLRGDGRLLKVAKRNGPAISLLCWIAAVAIACFVISVTGARPPGEAEMLKQIALEDSNLCEKFGLRAESAKFSDCMSDLEALRKRHLEMVASYDLP
jgi:hypothetical protein